MSPSSDGSHGFPWIFAKAARASGVQKSHSLHALILQWLEASDSAHHTVQPCVSWNAPSGKEASGSMRAADAWLSQKKIHKNPGV